MNKKVHIIVQARLRSYRLPGKVLLRVCGKSLLSHIFDRLATVPNADAIILATSNSETDLPLVKWAEKKGISYFAGDEWNVLTRFVNTVDQFPCDTVVRVTADCPFVDPLLIESGIEQFQQLDIDYLGNYKNGGFPIGTIGEVFSRKALMKADRQTQDSACREHVTLAMYTPPHSHFFSSFPLQAPQDYLYPQFRLCVDVPEDWEMTKRVYEALYQGEPIPTKAALSYLENHPHIAAINQTVEQIVPRIADS